MNKQKSFTLIELLVVIIIIGILAGVIMISTSSSIDKANIAKLKVFEESVANDLAANMVSRWKLDERTGASPNYRTPDTWGSNEGILYGLGGTQIYPQLKTVSECVTNSCFEFDGYDDHIGFTHSDSLDIKGKKITVSGWFNVHGLGSGGQGGAIVEKYGRYGYSHPE